MFRSLLVVLVCVSGAQAEQPGAGISKPIVRIGAESPAIRAARKKNQEREEAKRIQDDARRQEFFKQQMADWQAWQQQQAVEQQQAFVRQQKLVDAYNLELVRAQARAAVAPPPQSDRSDLIVPYQIQVRPYTRRDYYRERWGIVLP